MRPASVASVLLLVFPVIIRAQGGVPLNCMLPLTVNGIQLPQRSDAITLSDFEAQVKDRTFYSMIRGTPNELDTVINGQVVISRPTSARINIKLKGNFLTVDAKDFQRAFQDLRETTCIRATQSLGRLRFFHSLGATTC